MIVDQKRFQERAELKHQLHAQRIQKELKHQMYAQGIQKELKHRLHAQRIQKDRSYISGCLNPKRLLAPTGALVLMMVYYIYIYIHPLFQILSIYAFLYCYKCHSKSLKQYQCN